MSRHHLMRRGEPLDPARVRERLEQQPPGPLGHHRRRFRRRGHAALGRCGGLPRAGQDVAEHVQQPLGPGAMSLVQLGQPLLALLVDHGHPLAEHRRDLVPRGGAALVDQARQQRPPLRLADIPQVTDVGHPSLPGEMGDLRRGDAVKPHLGRAELVERLKVGQAQLELPQRRRLPVSLMSRRASISVKTLTGQRFD